MQPNQPEIPDNGIVSETSLNKTASHQTPEFVSLSDSPAGNSTLLQPKPPRFRFKKLAVVGGLLTVLGLLIAGVYLLRSPATKQASNVEDYPVSSLGLEKTTADLTVPEGATELAVNGDVTIAGILTLSEEAIADLGKVLTNKVSIQDTFPGTPQAGNANISGTFGASNFSGSGAGLTGLNATNLASGTLANARLNAEVSLLGQTIEASEIQPNIVSSINGVVNDGGNIDIVAGANVAVTSAGNTITITSLAGSAGITELVVGSGLTGGGTTSVVNIGIDSSVVTLQGNTFNGAGQLVQLNGLGQLPALNASQLTNLNASALATGTVGDARLSANVTLKNIANIFTPSSNSTAVMRIQNSATTVDVLRVDTSNSRVGIGFGTATPPGYTLDVNGDVNLAAGSAYRIGGTAICTSGGCAPSAGSSDYIQNSASIQTNANIAIQSATTTDPTLYIKGVASQTADLLRLEDSSGNPLFTVNPSGATALNGYLAINADLTSALYVVKDGSSPKTLRVDTTNNRVGIGLGAAVLPSYTLDVDGDMNIAAGSAYRIGGTSICTSSGCLIAGGATDFIHNSTSTQVANFNIQSANASDVVAVIKGAAGQTADIFQVKNSSDAELVSVSATGELNIATATNSTTAFRVQDASSNTILQADTTNSRVNIGGGSLAANLGITAGSTAVGQIINNTGTGASMQIKKSSTDVFTVSDTGQVVIQPSSNSTTALSVKNAAGGNVLQVATGNSASDSTPSMTFNGSLIGDIANWTTNANALPVTHRLAAAEILNGYMYVIGGTQSGVASSAVRYAPVNGGGSVGSWSSTTGLPVTSEWAGSAKYNGYLYVVLGGDSKVYYAKPNNNGAIISWTTSASTLPGLGLAYQKMVIYNGYMYLVGMGASYRDIYYAKLDANGAPGSFTTVSNALPSLNYLPTVVANNGYLVVFGGVDGSDVVMDNVYTFAVNASDGSLGSATATTSLPAPRALGTAHILNGVIYYAGGSSTGALSTEEEEIFYTRLNADGTITSWNTSSSSLGATMYGQTTTSNNGYLYLLGGTRSASASTAVNYMTTPRVQLGGTLDLVGISNGSLASGSAESGGSVYAGNISAAGQLSVAGNTNLAGGASVKNLLNVQGDAGFRASSAASTATLQVQNSSGSVLFNVDTANKAVSIGTATATAALTVVSGEANNLFQVVDNTASTTVMNIADGGATTFKTQTNSTAAFNIQNTSAVNLFSVDTTNTNILIGTTTVAVDIKLGGTGTTRNAITRDFTCTSTEQTNDIVAFSAANTVTRTTTADSNRVAGVVVAKPGTTICTTAIGGIVAVWFSTNGAPATIGDPVTTSTVSGAAQSSTTPPAGAMLGNSISTKDGSNLVWVRLR